MAEVDYSSYSNAMMGAVTQNGNQAAHNPRPAQRVVYMTPIAPNQLHLIQAAANLPSDRELDGIKSDRT